MDSNTSTAIDISRSIIGKWKETYQWIPIFASFLAFAAAFASGANNLPLPFSTSVGCGVLTLPKASLVAFIIVVPGTAFAVDSSVNALFSDFLKENQPNEGFLMWSLVAVLITAIIWLALAMYLELPVSSQQTMQSALLGTIIVTKGVHSIPLWSKDTSQNFNGVGLIRIILEWAVAPPIAGVAAFFLFGFLKIALLRQENAEKRILIFLPICYGASCGLLCLFLMYQVIPHIVTAEAWETALAVTLATFIAALLSLLVVVPLARRRLLDVEKTSIRKGDESGKRHSAKDLDQAPSKTTGDEEENFEEALKEFLEMRVLETVYEEDEQSNASPVAVPDIKNASSISRTFEVSSQITPLKKLLESTPNRLVQTTKFQKIDKTTSGDNFHKFLTGLKGLTSSPVEYDRHTLIQHALAENFDERIEDLFVFPQLLTTCTFALIQSAYEISAIVSPYEAILDIFNHRAKYSENGEEVGPIQVTWWLRALGGFGASIGFFLCGRRLTQCLGGKLIYISNSRGLCSQLCVVAIMIMLHRVKLPVSSTYCFIGSLLGVGIAEDPRYVNWKLALKFICGWIGTILFCCGVAYAIYSFTIFSPSYVVP